MREPNAHRVVQTNTGTALQTWHLSCRFDTVNPAGSQSASEINTCWNVHFPKPTQTYLLLTSAVSHTGSWKVLFLARLGSLLGSPFIFWGILGLTILGGDTDGFFGTALGVGYWKKSKYSAIFSLLIIKYLHVCHSNYFFSSIVNA